MHVFVFVVCLCMPLERELVFSIGILRASVCVCLCLCMSIDHYRKRDTYVCVYVSQNLNRLMHVFVFFGVFIMYIVGT